MVTTTAGSWRNDSYELFGKCSAGVVPKRQRRAAVLNAISAAVGDEVFRRAPVNADGILTSLEAGRPMMGPLTANV